MWWTEPAHLYLLQSILTTVVCSAHTIDIRHQEDAAWTQGHPQENMCFSMEDSKLAPTQAKLISFKFFIHVIRALNCTQTHQLLGEVLSLGIASTAWMSRIPLTSWASSWISCPSSQAEYMKSSLNSLLTAWMKYKVWPLGQQPWGISSLGVDFRS